jgi:cytoskeletal protein RodZ
MKTVGQVLKETRESKNLSLDEVATATKIQKKYLIAIESDDLKPIPSQAYASGFVKNYSEFLGLNSKHVMAFLRRQTKEVSKTTLLPKKEMAPLKPSMIMLTPTRFLVIIITILLLLFVGYFITQYQRLQQPPILIVEQPLEGQEVIEAKRIEVLGRTDPDATVTINSVGVLVRSDGKFFDQIEVFPGDNIITISSTSRYGKTSTVVREVNVPDS